MAVFFMLIAALGMILSSMLMFRKKQGFNIFYLAIIFLSNATCFIIDLQYYIQHK